MTIANRVAKLEAINNDSVIVMWRRHDESDEQARERWCVEHPGQDPDKVSACVIIIRWA